MKAKQASAGASPAVSAPSQTATPKLKATTAPGSASPSSSAPVKSHPKNASPSVRQQPTGTAAVPFNRTTIVLDPAHGGVDGGARITDAFQEKDVDLQFAFKLRSLLSARGFTVVLTRENDTATASDSATPLNLDDRAGIANHTHPVACLLIHSTGSGKGVHLYSSELTPIDLQPVVVPWLTAQASWVNSSRALQRELGNAITRAEIPLVMSRASVRPLDSLTCPALVVELAPQTAERTSVNDSSYQQLVANALASALVFWQNQAHPPDRQVATPLPAISPDSGNASQPASGSGAAQP